jgi:hypothetical protein
VAQLPVVGQDDGTWGQILNTFLLVSHNPDGTLQPSAIAAAGALQSGTSIPTSDLSGTYGNPTVAKLQGTSVNASGPANGQVLAYNATSNAWVPSTVSSATISDATTSNKGIVELAGDIGGAATNVTVTSTHLSNPLPINQGGTGSTAQNFVTLGGDLGNTVTIPKVESIQGVAISGTPSVGQALIASTSSAAAWSTIGGTTAWFNVKNYGAIGNGSANDASAINSALSAANTAGGGVVYIPEGTYVVGSSLTIYSNVSIIGDGYGATIIKLQNSANTDVLVGNNFSSLTGTNSTAGVCQFVVANLTVDGNKTNQSSAGYGIRIYGYDFAIDQVHVRNCYIDGLYTEWGTNGNPPSPDSMEGHFTNLKLHDNNGNGFHHLGPHDSLMSNCISYNNDGIGFWVDATSVATGVGLLATNCHSWGNSQTYAWQLDTQAQLANCVGEGATDAQVLIRGNNCSIISGLYFAANSTGYGIQIGDATHTSAGANINTQLQNFTGGGGLNLVNDAGNAAFRLNIYQTSGTPVVGTPAATSRLEISVGGLAAASNETDSISRWYGPTRIDAGTSGNALQVRNNGTDIFNINNGSSRLDVVNGSTVHLWSDNYTTTTGTWSGTTGVLTIDPATAATTGLVVNGYSGGSQTAALTTLQGGTSQTGPFLQALNASGQSVFYIDSSGIMAMVQAAATNTALKIQTQGNSTYSFSILANGKQAWGPGTGAVDTNLYRPSTGLLQSDNRIYGNDGIQTKTTAGTPADTSFVNTPADGTLAVDTGTNTLWIRSSGAWYQVTGISSTGSTTANTIPVFSGSQTITNSILSQNSGATTVSVGGNLAITASSSSSTGLQVTGQSGQSTALVSLQGASSQTGAFLQALNTSSQSLFYVDNSGAFANAAAGASNTMFKTQVLGDSFFRYAIHGDGQILWGPGNLTYDTNLYRTSTGAQVKTDNSFYAAQGVQTIVINGTPSDSSFTNTPSNGTIAVDSATNTLWIRSSGTWTQIGAGTGTITSVTAGDSSIVIGGTASAPTIETATLDVIATDHPAAASWSNNNNAITGISDLSVSGLTGATATSRYVGATASGPPTSAPTGGYLLGDYVIDQTGAMWVCITAGSPGTWAAIASPATSGDFLSNGEETIGRKSVAGSCSMASGTMRLAYFTARKSETINNIYCATSGTAAGATPTLCQMALYSVASNGNLTLVANCASDTTLFAAATTVYSRALTSSYAKVAGQRYAFGILVVTSAAAPTIVGNNSSAPPALFGSSGSPRVSGNVTGLSSLPSTITSGTVADTANILYGVVTP